MALAACSSWLAWAAVSWPFWALVLTWLMNALSFPQAVALLSGSMFLSGAVRLFANPAGSPIFPIALMRFCMAWAGETGVLVGVFVGVGVLVGVLVGVFVGVAVGVGVGVGVLVGVLVGVFVGVGVGVLVGVGVGAPVETMQSLTTLENSCWTT